MIRSHGFPVRFAGLFLLLAGLVLAAARAQAMPQVLQRLNYQGQLTDASGSPLTGSYNLTFRIYGASSGGTALWSENQTVAVSSGLFNVVLGSNTPIDLSQAVLNNGLWLSVQVAGDSEMTPRKQLLPSVFSFYSDNSNSVDGYSVGLGPNQIPYLDGSGKLSSAVMSAAFPLSVSGNAASFGSSSALQATDSDANPGHYAVLASGPVGVSASSNLGSGVGVYGASASGTGVQGASAGGTGVSAQGSVGLSAQGSNVGAQVQGASAGLQAQATTGYGVDASSGGPAGVRGSDSASAGYGVKGEHTGSGSGAGVYGSSLSSSGTGVYGLDSSASGSSAGVYGQANSASGTGVWGQAPNAGVYGTANAGSGSAFGVEGYVPNSAQGAGVYGQAPNTGVLGNAFDTSGASPSYGVMGKAASAQGTGVYGQETSGSGQTYGVYGSAASPQGTGVWGQAAASGSGAGVAGSSSSPNGTGVLAQNTAASGNPVGLLAQANNASALGQGVVALGSLVGVSGSASGSQTAYGLWGSGSGGQVSYGVYGLAVGDSNSYGVYGANLSPNGGAVFAFNGAANSQRGGSGYALGVYGRIFVQSNNAGLYPAGGPDPSTTNNWPVNTSFCQSTDVVLVTPQVNIGAGNSLWVVPNNGSFTVYTSSPVTGMRFGYLVISHN